MTRDEVKIVKVRGPNGGARPNVGRLKKEDALKMVELMDKICPKERMWELLLDKCEQGDTAAIKLWLSYNVGLPKQIVENTNININAGELPTAKIKAFNKELEDKY